MLRCVNAGGSDVSVIYQGMYTMCRHVDHKSDAADELFELPAYRFGQVTKVHESAMSTDNCDWQDVDIEFKFDDKIITAKGSDLLYWSVPKLAEADAASRMGATEAESRDDKVGGDDATANDDDDVNEEDEVLPPRKRQACDILDPSTYVSSRVIKDDSDSSDDPDFKELFPDSDKEDQEEELEETSMPAALGMRTSNGNAWGSPVGTTGTSGWEQSVSSTSVRGQPTGGTSGWGQSNIVTPNGNSQSSWGVASPSTLPNAAGWGSSLVSNTSDPSDGPVSYRKPLSKVSKRSSSDYAVQSNSVLEVYREDDSHFFLRWFFGNRLKIKEVAANLQISKLERTIEFSSTTYHLVASKYEKQRGRPSMFNASKFSGDYVKAFYLAEKSGVSVQEEFNAIANFAELVISPGKLAKRLELLVSTASCSTGVNKAPYTFLLPMSFVEEIDLPDNATMGCGFIPSFILSELLGGGKRADSAFGIRVRVVCPSMGIYKGNLFVRAGIKKIQLPNSMLKVGKSVARKTAFKGAFLIINQVYPSSNNQLIEREINPYLKPPTKTAEKSLEGIPTMVFNLLLACGVPSDIMEDYKSNCKHYEHRHHANLVGMCDCTVGGLPPGAVFISGIGVGGMDGHKVSVTRAPCTEPDDAKLVPIVSKKPPEMDDEDWNHLQSVRFGAIVFPSPKDDESMSLVEFINNSDLDGDNFFCLWDPTILPHLEENMGCTDDRNLPVAVEEGKDLLSEDDEDTDDGLLGTFVPVEIEGKTQNAVVASKADDGNNYVVKYGNQYEEIWSPVDLVADRAVIQEIIGHRGKGRKAEVEVQWEGGKRSWQSFSLMRKEVPGHLADYARKNNLLGAKGWCWCKDYIEETEIVSVNSHRTYRGVLQVEVYYDGQTSTEWLNAVDVDTNILVAYIKENNLSLSSKKWKWLEKDIKQAKKHWFNAVQERLSDIQHMVQHTRFIEALHRAFKKRQDPNNNESKSFGRAFKRAIDMGKHGGRIPLNPSLRSEIVGSKKAYANKFLKDE